MWRNSRSTGLTLAALFLASCARPSVDTKVSSAPESAAQAKAQNIVVTGSRMARDELYEPLAPPPPPPPAPGMYPTWSPPYHDVGRDKFSHVDENPFKIVQEAPVSTFSIDVDTASYSWVRASLNSPSAAANPC